MYGSQPRESAGALYSDDFFDENEDITNRDPRTLYTRASGRTAATGAPAPVARRRHQRSSLRSRGLRSLT